MSVLALPKLKILLDRLTQDRADALDNIEGSTSLDDIAATLAAALLDNLANLDAAVSTLGGQLTRETVTASQTLTAPDNATWARVILVGGGGAGMHESSGDDGPGGCGGEIIETTVAITGGGSYPVTIGAGGAVASNANGGDTAGFGYTARGGLSGLNNDDFGVDSVAYFERWTGGTGGGSESATYGGGTKTAGGSSKGLAGSAGSGQAGPGGGSWGFGGTPNGAGPQTNGGGGGAGGTTAGNGQDGAAGRIIVEWLE